MSLRDIFQSVIREKVYAILKQSYLRSWATEFVYKIIDDAMNEISDQINGYIYNNVVTLANMDYHAQVVAQNIVVPYISKKRVE
jgi:ABC-type polysaccharide transport system permease subunit